MDRDKIDALALLVVSTLLGAIGQFLFKLSFTVAGEFLYILALGVLLYVIATVIYLFVLSRTHLSWAYSLVGLSYIFAVLLAYLFLGENIPVLRWAGVLVIFSGVLLIGLS